jgi:hypothetical protein
LGNQQKENINMVILDKKVLVLNRFSLFGKLIFIEKQDENSVFLI